MSAKSSQPDDTPRTKRLPPNLSHIPCPVCGGRARVQPKWTPHSGLEPHLWKYTCWLKHDTYRTIHPKLYYTPPLGKLTVPMSEP